MKIGYSAAAVFLALGLAHAANPDHVREALNTSTVPACPRCDLTAHDFTGAFLRFANFYQSDLSGAIFDGADMAGTFLEETRMNGVSMRFTNASGAMLNKASIRDADLRDVWLNYAHLKDVDLSGADLTGAILTSAQIQGADLSATTGVTQGMLNAACADGRTRVPPGLKPSFECRR